MNIETVNEKIKACKFVGHENIVEIVEGDVIVPDIKPDILSLIHVDGNIFITKKEVQDGKVKIEGAVEVFAIYIADDEHASVKGLNALLNFSENIQMSNAKEGMVVTVEDKLVNIEHKVLNSRKLSVKASIDMNIKVIGEEELEITKDLQEPGNVQYQKETICLSELVGASCQKVEVKENVMLNDEKPPIAEILKTKLKVVNYDYKVSYNKILVKADLKANIVYVADNESMTIENFETTVPIAGFIDLPGVNEKNKIIIDTDMNLAYVKPVYQDLKANGVNIESQIEVCAKAYEDKNLEVLSDLYNPIFELNIENNKILLQQNTSSKQEEVDLSQVLSIPELTNATILDVEIIPIINEIKRNDSKITVDGTANLEILYYDREKKKVDVKKIELPYQKTFDSNCEECRLVVSDLGYKLRDNGQLELKIILNIICDNITNLSLNLISKIEQTENKNIPVASIIIYYVQQGDSLWKIAKRFKTTIELIKSANNLKDDSIFPGQQLIIPKLVEKININPLT